MQSSVWSFLGGFAEILLPTIRDENAIGSNLNKFVVHHRMLLVKIWRNVSSVTFVQCFTPRRGFTDSPIPFWDIVLRPIYCRVPLSPGSLYSIPAIQHDPFESVLLRAYCHYRAQQQHAFIYKLGTVGMSRKPGPTFARKKCCLESGLAEETHYFVYSQPEWYWNVDKSSLTTCLVLMLVITRVGPEALRLSPSPTQRIRVKASNHLFGHGIGNAFSMYKI